MTRPCSTICLPIGKDHSMDLIGNPRRFRDGLAPSFHHWPERFPKAFAGGYRLKEARTSRKTAMRLRRIRLKTTGESFSVRPSLLLPYMVGTSDDAQGPRCLRPVGVPFWALARVFGTKAMYWYRLAVSRGRKSIAGTTVRHADMPEHLLADEYHPSRDGGKNYLATTVDEGCCLGAALAPTANADDWTDAYEVFQRAAQDVQPCYRPQTIRRRSAPTAGQQPVRRGGPCSRG